MITNADMTLYSWSGTGYTRKPIGDVFWQESKQSNVEKTGLAAADSLKIFIPAGSVSEVLTFTTSKDLAVKGIISFEFDNTSEASRSASLKTFRAAFKVFEVTIADSKLYGSPELQHYQLSCK
jgi:hypothetical protein